MSRLEKIIIETRKWQMKTFPGAGPVSKLYHLKEEVEELIDALIVGKSRAEIKAEYADCFLLLFGSAQADGLTLNEIADLIREKHEINEKRDWGEPDENGVVKHIKENDFPSLDDSLSERMPDYERKIKNKHKYE